MNRSFFGIKAHLWAYVGALIVMGALLSNVVWLRYVDAREARFAERIKQIEGSYKYQMGQQRTKIEKKIDEVINKLDKLPQSPVIIDARSKLEEAKHEQ